MASTMRRGASFSRDPKRHAFDVLCDIAVPAFRSVLPEDSEGDIA
jgi:hypothetical protein